MTTTTVSKTERAPEAPFTSDDDRLSYGSSVFRTLDRPVYRTLAQKLGLRKPDMAESWAWSSSAGLPWEPSLIRVYGEADSYEAAWAATDGALTEWSERWDRRPFVLEARARAAAE